MKFKIYKKNISSSDGGTRIVYEDFALECAGSGTVEDPIIIESSKKLPDEFNILGYTVDNKYPFILIRSCINKIISIEFGKNITLKDCKLTDCFIHNSSEIKIENTTISNKLTLWFSHHISITNSKIKNLKFDFSMNNTIENCEIHEIESDQEDPDRVKEWFKLREEEEKAIDISGKIDGMINTLLTDLKLKNNRLNEQRFFEITNLINAYSNKTERVDLFSNFLFKIKKTKLMESHYDFIREALIRNLQLMEEIDYNPRGGRKSESFNYLLDSISGTNLLDSLFGSLEDFLHYTGDYFCFSTCLMSLIEAYEETEKQGVLNAFLQGLDALHGIFEGCQIEQRLRKEGYPYLTEEDYRNTFNNLVTGLLESLKGTKLLKQNYIRLNEKFPNFSEKIEEALGSEFKEEKYTVFRGAELLREEATTLKDVESSTEQFHLIEFHDLGSYEGEIDWHNGFINEYMGGCYHCPLFFTRNKSVECLAISNYHHSHNLSFLENFSNLKVLVLSKYTGDLTTISKLKTLETLSLTHCDISNIPEVIKNLNYLKVLEFEKDISEEITNKLKERGFELQYDVSSFSYTKYIKKVESSISEPLFDKSEVTDYIESKGLNVSEAILNGDTLNKVIMELLDKAINRARRNHRNIVKTRDL